MSIPGSIAYATVALTMIALRLLRPRVVPIVAAVPYALYFATLAVLHGGERFAWLAVPLDAIGTAAVMVVAFLRAAARDNEIDRRGAITDLTRSAVTAIDRASRDWEDRARAHRWRPPDGPA